MTFVRPPNQTGRPHKMSVFGSAGCPSVKIGQEHAIKSSCFRVPAPSSLLQGVVFKPWEVTLSPTPQAPYYQAWPASSWDCDTPDCLSHALQLLTFLPFLSNSTTPAQPTRFNSFRSEWSSELTYICLRLSVGEYAAVPTGREWGHGVEPSGVRRITEDLFGIGVVFGDFQYTERVVICAQDPRME